MNKYPEKNENFDDINYLNTQRNALSSHMMKCSMFIVDHTIRNSSVTLSLSDTPSVKLMVNSSTLGTFSLFFSVWNSVRVFTTTWKIEEMVNTVKNKAQVETYLKILYTNDHDTIVRD